MHRHFKTAPKIRPKDCVGQRSDPEPSNDRGAGPRAGADAPVVPRVRSGVCKWTTPSSASSPRTVRGRSLTAVYTSREPRLLPTKSVGVSSCGCGQTDGKNGGGKGPRGGGKSIRFLHSQTDFAIYPNLLVSHKVIPMLKFSAY